MKTDQTIFLISTARGVANAYLKQELRNYGLSGLAPTHGSIIFELLGREQMTMKELAAAIRRDKSTLTALIAKLESLGYVERFNLAEDNRVSLVRLTKQGRELREPFAAISQGLVSIGLKEISVSERRLLNRLLKKIISNFNE